MKLTKAQVIQMIQAQGPEGARAKLESRGLNADDYYIVAGQWEAGVLPLGKSTEDNWTILAILKSKLEINPIDGICKTNEGALVFDIDKGHFISMHGDAHQMDYQDGRVWYWDRC